MTCVMRITVHWYKVRLYVPEPTRITLLSTAVIISEHVQWSALDDYITYSHISYAHTSMQPWWASAAIKRNRP